MKFGMRGLGLDYPFLGTHTSSMWSAALKPSNRTIRKGEAMKDHYDFSNAERGKFYKPDAVFRLPMYLDEAVQDYLAAKADVKGVDLSDLVNDLLKREIEIIEAVR